MIGYSRSVTLPPDLAAKTGCVLVQDPIGLNRALVPVRSSRVLSDHRARSQIEITLPQGPRFPPLPRARGLLPIEYVKSAKGAPSDSKVISLACFMSFHEAIDNL